MAIEGTPLYEALEARWRNHPSWPTILNDLNRNHEDGLVNTRSTIIGNAMTWARTPQGQHYWSTINRIDQRLMGEAQPKEKKYAAEYH